MERLFLAIFIISSNNTKQDVQGCGDGSVRKMPHTHKDKGLCAQNPAKAVRHARPSVIPVWGAETGTRWRAQACQTKQNGELWAQYTR